MSFYESIAKYYDYIFPFANNTVEFIKRNTCENGEILDIACGTGEYSVELAKQGYKLTSVDLDFDMVDKLEKKIREKSLNIYCKQSDMLNLSKMFSNNRFDTIFCIGNSLAHLNSIDKVEYFISNIKNLLSFNGKLIIQIINFDRLLEHKITSLPTIYNNEINLIFEREYELKKNKINFKSILKVDDKIIENKIYLTPIYYDNIINIFKKSGFKDINVYGDFNSESYIKESSFMLVIEAS